MKTEMKRKGKRFIAILAVVSLILSGLQLPGGLFSVKAADITWVDGTTVDTPEKGKGYTFDFATTNTYVTAGTYGLMSFATGPRNGAGYKDNYYGTIYKDGNNLTFNVAGNCYIVVGGDNNNGSTKIKATSETGSFDQSERAVTTEKHATMDNCKSKGDNAVPFLYVGTEGTVTLTFDGTAYISSICIIPAADDITLTPYMQKTCSFDVNGKKVQVTSGETATDAATITVADGKTEICNAKKGIIWADLAGGGQGMLTQAMITNVSDNVDVTVGANNTIDIAYKDTSATPTGYSLVVKDNSASGTPSANGSVIDYNFKDQSIISDMYTSGTKLTGGATLESTDKLIKLVGNNGIFYNGSHGIYINNNDAIEVKVAGNATINFSCCAYTAAGGIMTATGMNNGTMDHNAVDFKAATDGDTVSFKYTGDATTLVFTYTAPGTGYIHSMGVTNEAPKSSVHEQTKMPSVATFGTAANLDATAAGQKLVLTQTGGQMKTTSGAIDSSVSYYVFPQSTDWNTLSADVVLNTCGASNYNGIFVGAFDGTNMATLAIRNSTGLRGVYSKSASDMAGAGGTNVAIEKGEKIHFEVVKTTDGLTVSATRENGKFESTTFKYNSSSYLLLKDNGNNSNLYYGFAVAGATATITNMELKTASKEVLYDQNACYDPLGDAPVATSVSAVADASREFINVSWTGDNCDGDGSYVLQASQDGVTYKDIAVGLTEKSFKYDISTAGNFYFRVCGTLGNSETQMTENRNSYVTIAEPTYVVAALTAPTVSITSDATSVSLKWDGINQAGYYEVYRYSYDETEKGAKKIATVTATSYKDTAVTAEMPYYYYVKAYTKNADNWSNASNTEWAVPSAGHTGEYVYEDEAADLVITKKSYDTVYTNIAVIEGVSTKAGTIYAEVNGVKTSTQNVKERGTFKFLLTLEQGRNDVVLYQTDANGNVTRKTFNFVYLTNYDKVVDQTFMGTDGDLVNEIPTYKSIQKAVDSVSSTNGERVVILVKEGTYVERLDVKSPYITLIGEDSEKTAVSYFDSSVLGGDMAKRCATYIEKTAVGFEAENITFENSYDYGTINQSNQSADALRTDAENVSFVNVIFKGYQDTLCANQGTQYYNKCKIYGTIDFIYGNNPKAYFDDCQMIFRYYAEKNAGYVFAPKTDTSSSDYGIILNNCQILSEDGCSGNGYLLARPWGADAYITMINCYMGKAINAAAPYADMSGASYKNARFFEYHSYGPGYTINAERRQISKTKAETMKSSLGWNPESVVADISKNNFVGSIVTQSANKFVTGTYIPTEYSPSEGTDTGLGKYSVNGYAAAVGVSGGGLLYETSEGYYKVDTAEEFLTALQQAKKTPGKKAVIELTKDIGLGCNEVQNFASYSDVITAYSAQPLTHPTLIQTGVSKLAIKGMNNLTIFSQNGSKILHANIDIQGSSNIIIRNIVFDELWEWDDDTAGAYDRNDWDYMTIEKESDNIWIDHCTFYKAYDGVIDIKDPSLTNTCDVTISWCEFLPASSGTFWEDMMKAMEANPSNYAYYQTCLKEGMTAEQIRHYAYGQKKTHLLGQSADAVNAVNIRLTLANNYYKDSMDRMPRLRYGVAHVYNCIMDASTLEAYRKDLLETCGAEVAKKIVSNGASSTCDGQLLLENCYISGIENALNSGNGSDPAGYINAINSTYFLNGALTKLEPKSNSTTDNSVLVTDTNSFKEALPYSGYILFNSARLNEYVAPLAGAGKLSMSVREWEKTTYNDTTKPETGFEPVEDNKPVEDDKLDDSIIEIEVNGSDWTGANNKIEKAEEGQLIIITLKDTDEISANNFMNLIKKSISKKVVIELPVPNMEGISWIIDSSLIAEVGELGNIKIGVTLNTDSIPTTAMKGIPKGTEQIQMSLAHDGPFGIPMTLKINLDTKNAGQYANLYYYNPETGVMELVESALIAEDGNAKLGFTHASEYVIVVSSENLSAGQTAGDSTETGDHAPIKSMLFIILLAGSVLAYEKKKLSVNSVED